MLLVLERMTCCYTLPNRQRHSQWTELKLFYKQEGGDVYVPSRLSFHMNHETKDGGKEHYNGYNWCSIMQHMQNVLRTRDMRGNTMVMLRAVQKLSCIICSRSYWIHLEAMDRALYMRYRASNKRNVCKAAALFLMIMIDNTDPQSRKFIYTHMQALKDAV